MSSFVNTVQDTAKEASARIADSAAGAAKVAGKRVSSGYDSAFDLLMTGVKLLPTVTAALGFFGLQRKRSSIIPTTLALGAGLAVGAGLGMLMAPKSGPDLRKAILDYLNGTPLEGAAKKAEAVAHGVTDKVDHLKSDLKNSVSEIKGSHNGSRTVS